MKSRTLCSDVQHIQLDEVMVASVSPASSFSLAIRKNWFKCLRLVKCEMSLKRACVYLADGYSPKRTASE